MSESELFSAITSAKFLEKIEVMRNALRWAGHLERPEIEKLLNQCNALRDELVQVASKERFIQISAAKDTSNQPLAQRRQALLERQFVFEGVFGDNLKLIETLEIAEKTALTDLPVLIDGESGTGKELLARVIHLNSKRAQQPYISINCGAIPPDLLESELFGHKKGAFTGATSDRKGKFESANAGTLFLDEIGELPLQGQVKLLRALQSHEIQRVGSDEPIAVDIRIVAATNKNLPAMVKDNLFREDLFYRLSVIHVTLPPLRERKDELPLLNAYFCEEAAAHLGRVPIKMSSRLRNFLRGYNYPGNIRELRNIIYRLSCLADEVADLEHLPETIRPTEARGGSLSPLAPTALSLQEIKKAAGDAAEREFLVESLQETGGRVAELARRINITRPHLQTLLKKHGIRSRDFRPTDSASTARTPIHRSDGSDTLSKNK